MKKSVSNQVSSSALQLTLLKVIAFGSSFTMACGALAQVGGADQAVKELNNTDAMFAAATECDQTANPTLSALRGKLPMSLAQMMETPTLRELTNDRYPTTEEQELIKSYSDATRGCMAKIDWLINKNMTPLFARSWRTYSFKMTNLNERLAKGAETYGDARRMSFDAATVMQNELDTYRASYTDGKQPVPNATSIFNVCIRDTTKFSPSDALAYVLRKSTYEITAQSQCSGAQERDQADYRGTLYDPSSN